MAKNVPSTQPLETIDLSVAMEGLSAHSQRAYLRHIRAYLARFHDLKPRQIDIYHLSISFTSAALSPLTLRNWLGALKQQGLSGNTLAQARTAIIYLADLLADLGRANPDLPGALRRVKVPAAETGQRGLQWLTADEIKAVLAAVPQVPGLSSAAITRNRAIVTLIATTGLRREEVAHALWSDLVKMGGYWVLIVHGKGEQLRHVKLPSMALEAINAWQARHPLPEGDRPLFSQLLKGGVVTVSRLSPKAVWEIVETAARAAGLKHISPHVLRRSFARGAFESGAPFELIRQTLGHESVQTTERYVNAMLDLDHAATDIWADGLDGD